MSSSWSTCSSKSCGWRRPTRPRYGADAIDRSLGETLLAHERSHISALERVLAGRGNPSVPVFSGELTKALRGRRSFAEYAIWLEDKTVRAYSDSVPRIRDPKLRQPLGIDHGLRWRPCGGA
jgi:hypothetical protein